jgi:hypothetical protein
MDHQEDQGTWVDWGSLEEAIHHNSSWEDQKEARYRQEDPGRLPSNRVLEEQSCYPYFHQAYHQEDQGTWVAGSEAGLRRNLNWAGQSGPA